jgi:hypothetical protein
MNQCPICLSEKIGTFFHLKNSPILQNVLFQTENEAKTKDLLGLHNNVNESFGRVAYPLVFITGFLAIGYEIVWFRVVGVLVKASTYAFSTTLSVYLLGIAIGSVYMSRYLKHYTHINKKNLFLFLQF